MFRGLYIRSSTVEISKGVEEWTEGCINHGFLKNFCILWSFNILKILLAEETGPFQD